MNTPRRTRHETRSQFALRILSYLKGEGVPDLVTDSEAHRLAARFELDIYDAGDHTTPVPRATLARAIARRA